MSYIRLFVGLGGFGSSVVQKLYKIVKEENNGKIPDNVKFAAYDSAMHEKPAIEDFPNAVDFMVASPEIPQDFLLNCKTKYKGFDKWWPGIWLDKSDHMLWNTSDLQFSGRGLGQYRPFGRLGFFKHLKDKHDNIINVVETLLNDAAHTLKVDVNATNPRIIIVNSLAGGTGSSSFIDVAFILKHKLSAIKNSEFILFTVTGDASMRGRASTESDAYQWALANSYAALTELDYWMNDKSPVSELFSYPRYGEVVHASPAFKHTSIICQDNKIGKNLPKYSDYIKYLAECLNVIDVRVTSSKSFSTPFDNILAHMKRYGSIGVGSIHYRYEDALLYTFSLLSEEVLTSVVLRPCAEEVKDDLEKELNSIYLEDDAYYAGDVNTLNPVRKDNIFDLLEAPYTDERQLTQFFPFVSLTALDAKISHANIQSVLKGIEDLDKQMVDFLNVKKKEVYNKINQKIKSHIFYNTEKGSRVTLSYIREYLTQLKTLIDARSKGLERDIQSVFEEIHLKQAYRDYLDKKNVLERRPKKKYLEEFRISFQKLYNIKKFVYKVKAKFELYKNLGKQLEWYIKAVEEIYTPVNNSILKHYRSMKQGIQLGTYSEYDTDVFTIYALPVDTYFDKYREILDEWKRMDKNNFVQIKDTINDKMVDSIKKLPGNIGDLLEIYQIQPSWKEETFFEHSKPVDLNYDKKEVVKTYLKDQLSEVMNREFKGYISKLLPNNAIEALYIESRLSKKHFIELLNEKRMGLENLVEPFVVLKDAVEKDEERSRTPQSTIIIGKDDVVDLFTKHSDDQDLLSSKDDIYDLLVVSPDNSDTVDKDKNYAVEGHLDKITLVKIISGFRIGDVAAYTNKFKSAFESLTKYESFVDIRSKPDMETKEVVFLLAEFFSIIQSKEPQFKFEGRTLDKGLKGRGNVIKWFTSERDGEKIKRIKNKLIKEWNKVPNSEKRNKFEEVIKQLEGKKNRVKDEYLMKVLENNIKTMEHALQFKTYETIDKNLI